MGRRERLRMCFRCLRGHMQAKHVQKEPCKICRGGHHRLLHQERTTIEGHEGAPRRQPSSPRHSDHQKPEASSATRRRATVAACSHLTDIAENLIYDAAAPCILIGQDNWGLLCRDKLRVVAQTSLPPP
ncbi:hypothetical protein EVAR_66095_1 [Eumeta japonica]|uniref:Uncharacterized protein n=1 Tax=Eumeta variegata TaxID=151549 RepID=A0A4C1ZXX0_EUMVA|nr:hypothetical protein EVAR_66095_1 [Eumeta japonica]